MARVPAFARPGDPIDIWVSSIGDAKSLKGGCLLQTPLKAADEQTYAVAQVSIPPYPEDSSNGTGNFSSSHGTHLRKGISNRSSSNRNRSHVTTVHVPAGAVIEKPVIQSLSFHEKRKVDGAEIDDHYLKLSLVHFDIMNAKNAIEAINKAIPGRASLAKDGTILVKINKEEKAIDILNTILDLKVDIVSKAKVVIDPRSATIVMGENVGISPVSVTKNGMTIEIGKDSNEFSESSQKKVSSKMLPEAANVSQLVTALNDLGLSAEDIIDVIKAVHAAGALHAELVIL